MEKKIILKLRSRRVEINSGRIDIFTGSFTPGRVPAICLTSPI